MTYPEEIGDIDSIQTKVAEGVQNLHFDAEWEELKVDVRIERVLPAVLLAFLPEQSPQKHLVVEG